MGQVSKDKLQNLKRQSTQRIRKKGAIQENQSVAKTSASRPEMEQISETKWIHRGNSGNEIDHRTKRTTKSTSGNRSSAWRWHWQWNLPYLMTAFAMTIALVTVFFHGIDLLFAWPFHRASVMYDSTALVCGLVFAMMCISVYGELQKLKVRT